MNKVEMIQRSMRCFVLGLLGLLPVVGLPMALMAGREYRRVRRSACGAWNPAQRYLTCGRICARVVLTVYLVVALPIVILACKSLLSD